VSVPTSRAVHDARQRRVLIGLALMFFAPLGLSFYLYYGRGTWHPGGRVNAGDLIQPPRPLPELSLPLLTSGQTQANFLKGKWTFLYVQHGACEAECSRHLYDTRQVRLALDREMHRVQRVFIADEDCCDLQALVAAHPDLITVKASAADQSLLTLLPNATSSDNSGLVYVIDPLGNLMMSYSANAKSKGMLEDMKRLLRLSSIG
jgi:cytochrome oxidase Cu insertion factor (SCO1/SenC/PrrC family)